MGIVGAQRVTLLHAFLQYADDACVITSSKRNAQCILNLLQAWCNWSGLEVRNNKCVAFSSLRKDNSYQQILPVLNICGKPVPPVPIGDHFKYLGRIFQFDSNLHSVKAHLLEKITSMLSTTAKFQKF